MSNSDTKNNTDVIETLVANRDAFNAFVYLPLNDAIEELKVRSVNTDLIQKIEKTLGVIPSVFEKRNKLTLFRHIATPNYEIRRFINIVDFVKDFDPLILEYTHDKFTNRNEWKYSLGKVIFYKGINKLNEQLFENRTIVDFNTSNGTLIKDVQTNWGQSLVEFHHDFFFNNFPHLKDNVFDISEWILKNGASAKEYYKYFFLLFVAHGILLENFLLEGKELEFTKEVILPALFEIEQEFGIKPIIVALEPTEVEDSKFWLAHPHDHISVIDKML